MTRFEPHAHTHYSNIRLLDCINKPKNLINRAIELGLSGIALTDHEALCGHVEANIYAQELVEKYPDFKVVLGNEIYLCRTRESNQKYYHCILLAKNAIGHKALRELSSRAWMNSYFDRGMERCVTLYSDLAEILAKYPNSLIMTTACLGGELSTWTSELIRAERLGDQNGAAKAHNEIVRFVQWAEDLFREDWYIECAPGQSKEQIEVNKRLVSIAACFNKKMVIGTDAHYLKKEDRFIHQSYLNSKDGEREVAGFYDYAYLQSEEEIKENLLPSGLDYDWLVKNSEEIYNKIENYSLLHPQTISKVPVKYYPKITQGMDKYPVLKSLLASDDIYDRYWVNQCLDALERKNLYNETYLSRLEEEADIKVAVGKGLGTNVLRYPIVLQHYIDMMWEIGSTIGAGRGSSCSGLNHYLLGVTQLDPIKWNLPFFRYMNKDRAELPDIDLDMSPSKRPLILKEIKKERGKYFNNDIDDLSKNNLGCTLVATFGTEGTKSTILTACRGYRSVSNPDGIDNDTAQYMASLIPSERGFLWSLSDAVYGNPDKDRQPITLFINEVEKYPGLLDIMFGIEGLINKRSSHASGVILFDEDPYEHCAFMRTPKGEIITQFDLHMAEAMGNTKYDFLVTEVQDKITEALLMIQKEGLIDQILSLREIYDKYLHPDVLPIEDKETWENIRGDRVLNVFQFDSDIGRQGIKKVQPKTILELSDTNGLIRLMTAEKGEETPLDKYVRFKNNLQLWYQEMGRAGLTEIEQKVLEKYFKQSFGVPPSQEQMMWMLMDENICGFTLKEANAARKIVGKKQMAKIPELKEKVLKQAKSPALGEYVWKYGIGPQMGYAFSLIHALAYTFIGYQTAYIATKWPSLFWNCACLRVNSASMDDSADDKASDYAKIAKAIGQTRARGIKVSLVDINKSSFGFEPDLKNNQILFGMKGLSRVNGETIDAIIAGRPYKSFKDFLKRCPLNKTIMISLIKAGAFDNLEIDAARKLGIEPRMLIMTYYISIASEPKKKLNLQNVNSLIQKDILPDSLDFEKRVFNFNKYLKAYQKSGEYFIFNQTCEEFYNKYFNPDVLEVVNGVTGIKQKEWDKIYKREMETIKKWLASNQTSALERYNYILFKECWDKYATGNISSWEMESLCFYYHDHELAQVDTTKYGLSDFFSLPKTPEVDYYFKRGGAQIPIFKTSKISGTVLSKNDTRHSIDLLTTTGVVNVKFTKDHYAMYNRQLSEVGEDGAKHVVESGWFKRGIKLMLTGFRRDDQFVVKTYSHTPTHSIYKITEVNGSEIEIEHERTEV